jgi:hypothetical protein
MIIFMIIKSTKRGKGEGNLKRIIGFLLVILFAFSLFTIRIPLTKAQSSHRIDAIAVWSHDTRARSDPNLYDIYYSIYDATADTWWSSPASSPGTNPTPTAAPIANLNGNDYYPAISFDQQGRAMAVWSHDTGPGIGFDIYYSQWDGSLWTAPVPIAYAFPGDDLDPAVALWSDGSGVAVWENTGKMYYSLWNGAWTTPTLLYTQWPPLLSFTSKQPEVAYDSHHNAIAIWTDDWSDNWHVYYSVLVGNLPPWTTPTDLDPTQPSWVAYATRKGISADGYGNAIAVWNFIGGIGTDTQYAKWDVISRTFSPAAPIFPGSPYDFGLGTAVAFDQQNNVIAVHGSDHSNPIVWSNRYVAGHWQPEQEVDVPVSAIGAADYSEPRVVYTASGLAVAVWTAYNPPYDADSNIYYRVWRPDANPYLGHWTLGGPIDPNGLVGDDGPAEGPVSIASASCPTCRYGVAVTGVVPQRTVIGQGFSVNLNVTIQSQGDVTEPVNVTVYANTTVVETKTNITLASGNSTNLTFTWNTTGFVHGNYTINAYAWPVPGETDTFDNNFTTTAVTMTIPGDITGDFKVDLRDLVILAKAYGTAPSDANYNPNADIAPPSTVGLSDLVTLAQHYGQHYP